MATATRQINIRVSQEAFDAFDAVVFLQELRSVQEILGPVLEAHARELAERPDVRGLIAMREAHRETRRPANVTDLRAPTRTQRTRGGDASDERSS